MDYRLDDTEHDATMRRVDDVRAILTQSAGYSETVEAIFTGFQDVNGLLEEYGFESVHSLDELKEWL